MVTDKELYESEGHTVELVDFLERKRIAYVYLYEQPGDSEREYSCIALDDNIIPGVLFQDHIRSIKILD